jgi:hypothetical protein
VATGKARRPLSRERGGVVQLVLGPGRQNHVGACFAEGLGKGNAEAGGGASDDDDPVVEAEHVEHAHVRRLLGVQKQAGFMSIVVRSRRANRSSCGTTFGSSWA